MPLSDAEVLELRQKLETQDYLNAAIVSVARDLLEGEKLLRELKRCSRCREYLPVDDFAFNKAEADGFNRYCRNCCREYKALKRPKKLKKI